MHLTPQDWIGVTLFGAFLVLGIYELPTLWRDPKRWSRFSPRWVGGMPLAIAGGSLGVLGFVAAVIAAHTDGFASTFFVALGVVLFLGSAACFLLGALVVAVGRPRSLIPPAFRR